MVFGELPPVEGTVCDKELLWPRHSVHGAISKEEKAAEVLEKKTKKTTLSNKGGGGAEIKTLCKSS